jgi:hypothetical protein
MMTKNEFKQRLAQGDLVVTFIKKRTGELRTMRCTANIPVEWQKPGMIDIGEIKDGPVVVYSVDDKSFRSFYLENVVEITDADSKFGLLQE